MNMIPCEGCGRHYNGQDSGCPFCTKSRSPLARKALYLVGGAITTVVLAACYGVGGFDDFEGDQDGDGWDSSLDCDDNDAAINPGAVELCEDGIDNNCDGVTDAADADCVSEDTDDTDTDDTDTDDTDTDTDTDG